MNHHYRPWDRIDGEISTSPVRDPYFSEIVDRLDACANSFSLSCKLCPRHKECLGKFDKLCNKLNDRFMTEEIYKKAVKGFEVICVN